MSRWVRRASRAPDLGYAFVAPALQRSLQRVTYEQLGRDALLALCHDDAVIVDATCRSAMIARCC